MGAERGHGAGRPWVSRPTDTRWEAVPHVTVHRIAELHPPEQRAAAAGAAAAEVHHLEPRHDREPVEVVEVHHGPEQRLPAPQLHDPRAGVAVAAERVQELVRGPSGRVEEQDRGPGRARREKGIGEGPVVAHVLRLRHRRLTVVPDPRGRAQADRDRVALRAQAQYTVAAAAARVRSAAGALKLAIAALVPGVARARAGPAGAIVAGAVAAARRAGAAALRAPEARVAAARTVAVNPVVALPVAAVLEWRGVRKGVSHEAAWVDMPHRRRMGNGEE